MHSLSSKRLRQMGTFLHTLENAVPPRRYPADCIDVALTAQWAKEARVRAGLEVAVLGALVMGHFGNNLLTFGILCPALTPTIRWSKLSSLLEECTRISGHGKSWGLHSRNCIAGCGFAPVKGRSYHYKYVNGFKWVRGNSSFQKAVGMMEAGITCFDDYETVRREFQQMGKDIPGSWGHIPE